jgi:GWxTD domain-containing protein
MKKFILLQVLIVFAFTVNIALPQDETKFKDFKPVEKKSFYLDALVFYGKDTNFAKGRLDLYIEIPLASLQFKKNQSKNTFDANADYTIVILNSANNVVYNNTFTELVQYTLEQYKTVNDVSDFIIKQFLLDTGSYTMNFLLRDKNNYKETSDEVKFVVKDPLNKDFISSDLMIVSDYKENENGKKVITPLVNNNIGNLKEFYLFFEIYNFKDLPLTLELKYESGAENEKPITSGTFSYVLQPGENKKIEKVPTDNFTVGDYSLKIINAKNSEIVTEKKFTFRWGDLPVSIKDLDLAISQMVYIATEDELDKIKDAKTLALKEQLFIKFWKDKDPTPGTPRNEIMVEYYNRIKYANEKFSHYVDGWKTDMGMVYIIYGEPSNIESYPFGEYSKPYEIWSYYDINKRYIFVDDSGYGDFRLITPIWDKQATRLKY